MEGALFNPGFLGSHFLWWVGQIAPSETWRGNQQNCRFSKPSDIPGWGYRYKVRIIGLHDKAEDEDGDSTVIPNDQLPWAQVMYPVTAGGGQGGAFTTPNIRQGNFVFGFFLDGQDQQVPVIMGVLGNNAKTEIPDLDSHIFAPMSGYANASEDPSDVIAKGDNIVEPNSAPTSESSGDAINVETAATNAQEATLEEEVALACPDPATNSEMQNIQTVMKQMSVDIQKKQEALTKFPAAAGLPTVEMGKSIDEIVADRGEEVTKYMGSIMGRVQQYTTGEYGDQLRQMLALAPTSAGLDLREFQLDGLSGIAGTFAGITEGLPGIVLGALKNAFKKKKSSSPSPSPTKPQVQGPGSEVIPPLPQEGYYIPTPMCATEEVVGEVLGSTINQIMKGFDDAIQPAVTAASGKSGSAGKKAAGSSPFDALGGLSDLSGMLGGLGALKGMNFDISTAIGFVGDIATLFDSAPKPDCSPNTAFTMASGGNGSLEIPSTQSITDAATNFLDNQNLSVAGVDVGDALGGITEGVVADALPVAATAVGGPLGGIAASALTGEFEVPSLDDPSAIFSGQNLGRIAGTALGGPVGGMVGEYVGGTIAGEDVSATDIIVDEVVGDDDGPPLEIA